MPRKLLKSTARRRQHRIDVLVGRNICRRRQLQGMSMTALGNRIGLGFQQVNKYESAENRVSAGVLHMIAGELGVLPSYFFIDNH